MAMTVAQAQQIVQSQQSTDKPPEVGPPGSGGGTGTTSGVDGGDLFIKMLNGTATDEDLANGVSLGLITAIQAMQYRQAHPQIGTQQTGDLRGSPTILSPDQIYDAQGNPVGQQPLYGESPTGTSAGPYGGGITDQMINDAYARIQNGTATFADQVLIDRVASDRLLYGSGGAGSANAAAQLAYDYAQLEEKKREFGLTFPEQQREFDLQRQMQDVQNRASTALNTGDLVRGLANDSYQRALDPGNYPAYLAASAGLPQGTGSPISALIGQGVQIQSPEGANPLADPRFQNLLGNLYDYAQPGAVGTVQAIANQNGGQLPQAFYDYTHTQNPNVPQHAAGGSQILNEPVVGMGMQSGRPLFLAGEAGQERINFTPMHQHETEGMPTPHQHDGGDASHEHMGQMIRYADGGTAITGISPTRHQLISAWNAYHPNEQQQDDTFTPAEGTAMSLGKALQPLGYVPPYLIQQLMEGRTPTPGSIDEATLSRLPPSLRALLQAQIKSALGSAGLMDYNFQLDQNALPGLNNNGITSTVYSS